MRRSLMTKPKPETKTKKKTTAKNATSSEFDDWADEKKKNNTNCCGTCGDTPFAETTRCLLQAMIRKKAHKILIRDIFETAQKKHPLSDVGMRSFERHLRVCERSLYFRARGRKGAY